MSPDEDLQIKIGNLNRELKALHEQYMELSRRNSELHALVKHHKEAQEKTEQSAVKALRAIDQVLNRVFDQFLGILGEQESKFPGAEMLTLIERVNSLRPPQIESKP